MQRSYKINRLSIVACALLWYFIFPKQILAQNTDINILRSISTSRNYSYEKFHKGLSFSVYPALVFTPASIFSYGYLHKDTNQLNAGLCIATGIALNTALAVGLKYSIHRDRPYQTYPTIKPLDTEVTPSMPSGHTASAFNVATSLTLFYPKWYVAVPAYTWATGVAYSRLYLGVHYPSDVLAGAILGSGTAWLTYYLNKKWFRKGK